MGCELHKYAFDGRAPPGPACGGELIATSYSAPPDLMAVITYIRDRWGAKRKERAGNNRD